MLNPPDVVVWAADIGSVAKGNFGWCRAEKINSQINVTGLCKSISEFAHGIAKDISQGKSVALGFECPLFVPVTSAPNCLTEARVGESNRPWSAAGGSGALTTGLPICVWVFEHLLQEIQELGGPQIKPTFRWELFFSGQANLFVWEAFVTGDAKQMFGNLHYGDAEIAARSFWKSLPDIVAANSVTAEAPYSLVGAALLRAKLTTDLSLLSQSCIVIKN